MKKILLLVCLVSLINAGLTAQITPIKNLTPIKLKGTVPFFVKGSTAIKYIVPAGSTNPSFRMQRASVTPKRNETVLSDGSLPDANGRYCTTSTVSEEKGDYTKIVLGNQNDKIYPGAIYYDNAFLEVPIMRPPIWR